MCNVRLQYNATITGRIFVCKFPEITGATLVSGFHKSKNLVRKSGLKYQNDRGKKEKLASSLNLYTTTLWPLVRERTIPTDRPPLVDEILCQLLWIEGCRVVSAADPLRSLISVF
jgi:hypothetical protein